MAIITSPENLAKLDRYKEISRRLAHAEGLTDAQARALAREGKAVVWIDGGLHATEVLGAAAAHRDRLPAGEPRPTPRRCASCDDVHHPRRARQSGRHGAGVELVHAGRRTRSKRAMNIPRLYQKYIGHDNNRDFYMSNQPETQNMNQAPVPGVVSRRSSTTITRPAPPAR